MIKEKIYFLLSLFMIALLFLFITIFAYCQFSSHIVLTEHDNQKKIGLIFDNILNNYFNKFKFIVENTAIQSAFIDEPIENDVRYLYQENPYKKLKKMIQQEGISNILTEPQKSMDFSLVTKKYLSGFLLQNWQVFKGLPYNYNKNSIENQRYIAAKILNNADDILYIFNATTKGDILFIEPYQIQKNSKIFNYNFRNSIKEVNYNKKTVISEVYMNGSKFPTQTITIATPVFNKNNKLISIIGATISAETLKNRIFDHLSNSINANGMVLYLLDSHAHVVASSTGKNIYFPLASYKSDTMDIGNFRKLKIFENIKWDKSQYEMGSIWQRNTETWEESTLLSSYYGQYNNIENVKVITAFFPIKLGDKVNFGLLIESPIHKIMLFENQLKIIFIVSGIILMIILFFVFIFSFKRISRLELLVLRKQSEKEKAILEVSMQVAHDIRSPLAALNILTMPDTPVTEQSRILVRNAISRIRDIANDIVEKNRDLRKVDIIANYDSTQLLAAIICPVITEKRLQFRSSTDIDIGLELTTDNYYLFVKINLIEFKRMLSNIIDNAIDSLVGHGKVNLKIYNVNNFTHLSISDNGSGIPSSILDKLGEYGMSYNKPLGSGLGLYHAKKTMEQFGGKLEVKSKLGKGTDVILVFPPAPIPKWFYPQLNILQGSTLIILDDDITIHQLWNERLNDLKSEISIVNFTSPLNFYDWHAQSRLKSTSLIYLFDLEFVNFNKTGINIIEECNIQQNSILVTSHFEDADVHVKCEKLGVKIVPKNLLLFVPITVEKIDVGDSAEREDYSIRRRSGQ